MTNTMMSNPRPSTSVLLAGLSAAQEQCEQRPGLVEGPDGPEYAWGAFERVTMHQGVNNPQGERGLLPVSPEESTRVSRLR
ncbi:hypothetical protein [Streptomyces sp. NPDC059783]|uniref:hypothetical protein n=1 Tax=Streptomyces sp. NPDC059783 TaxID=3346944 RepID=UPI00364DD5BA